MNFGPTTYGLGLLAGALSTLSPCVLPLVPVLVATAVSAHRWGAVALGVGLALSFAVIGIFIATIGVSLGLDADTLRTAGGVILAAFGVILLVPTLQVLLAQVTGSLTRSGGDLLAKAPGDGLVGQFWVGSLLGLVWSPCVGPTLGAATTLASQGKDLGQITLLMLIFGFGAAAPLIVLGSLSRASMLRVRGRLLTAGHRGKQVFGVLLIGMGVLIASGLDKSLETWLLDHSPDWLTQLTTRF